MALRYYGVIVKDEYDNYIDDAECYFEIGGGVQTATYTSTSTADVTTSTTFTTNPTSIVTIT